MNNIKLTKIIKNFLLVVILTVCAISMFFVSKTLTNIVQQPQEQNIQKRETEKDVYWKLGGYENGLIDYLKSNLQTEKFNSITKIEFNNTSVTNKTITSDISLDLSKNNDSSVRALVSGDTVYIQYDGILYFNEDSSDLFKDTWETTTITSITGLEYVNTSKVTNMSGMFNGLSKLTKLDVSSFDTSNVTDMSLMFGVVEKLTTLDVSNFDTSNVTDMSFMFVNLKSVTELDVSNFDTSNVTDMSCMFRTMLGLTKLNVSNFKTRQVTDMSYMFGMVEKLTTLDVSNFDTSNVTDMSAMFQQMQKLTSLDVSNFDTSNVTDMSDMFSMTNLIRLDISNFDTSNVTDMSGMFSSMGSLKELDVSNFDTSNVTDMSFMFRGMSELTALDVSNFDTSNVTDMTCMFAVSKSLKKIYASKNFTTNKVTSDERTFDSTSSLVGQNNTVYNATHIGKEYARLDTPGNPGYFSVKVTSDKYKIDDANKYIYVGNQEIKKENIKTSYGEVIIDGNVAKIKYENEVVASYNILSINFNGLEVKNKTITISEEMQYNKFTSKIAVQGVTYKIFNGTKEVTEGAIADGMVLKVYKDNQKIDEYYITVFTSTEEEPDSEAPSNNDTPTEEGTDSEESSKSEEVEVKDTTASFPTGIYLIGVVIILLGGLIIYKVLNKKSKKEENKE